jgi:hypothetical protein
VAEVELDFIQRGTVNFGEDDLEKVITLPTPLTEEQYERSIVTREVTVSPGGRPDTIWFLAELEDDGETLRIRRGSIPTTGKREASVAWTVATFKSGLTVTRYSGSNSYNTSLPFGHTIDPDLSFLIYGYYFSDAGGTSVDDNETTIAQIWDDENFRIRSSSTGTGAACTWHVQLVEFDADAGAYCQQVVQQLTGGASTTVELSTPIDPTHTTTFGGSFGAGFNGNEAGLYTDWASGGEEIVLKKQGTGTAATAVVHVVRWPDHVTAFRYAITDSLPVGTTTELTIVDVGDWDTTLVYSQAGRSEFGQPGNNASGARTTQFLMVAPGSTTGKIAVTRASGSTYSLNSPYLVVQILAFGASGEPTFAWPGDPFTALSMMQDGHWHCPTLAPANVGALNRWTDVKVPNSMARTPAANAIFFAWPSMAFDSKRLETVHYGGGHGNNCWNNELYTFSWVTGNWSRLCRPSAMVSYSGTLDYYGSILGEDDAPGSAHTYANNGYMPIADAFITFGGAATQSGSRFQAEGGGNAGPYLYDLSKRDPMKVGGADGTGILEGVTDTDSEGLYAWSNAYNGDFVSSSTKGVDWTYLGAEGSIDVRVEDGKDVIYAARFDKFTKIVINDPYDWSLNTLVDEAYEASGSGIQQGAFIHSAQLFFWCLNGTSTELDRFRAWAMNGTKSTRFSITVADPDNVVAELSTGLQEYSYVWDEVRDRVLGCNRYGQIIAINHPGIIPNGSNDAAVTSGWTLELIEVGWDADYRQMESTESAGRYGATKYVRALDALVKVEYNGSVEEPFAWIWKPERDWDPIYIAALEAVGLDINSDLGTPSLSQRHGLVALGIDAACDVGLPSAGQDHGLTAKGVSISSLVGLPGIGQIGDISAVGLDVVSDVGLSDIGQGHVLAARGLDTGALIGRPNLSTEGTDALAAVALSINTDLGQPAMAQKHGLSAVGVVSGILVGRPAIGQVGDLTALGLDVLPGVGSPAVTQDGFALSARGIDVSSTMGSAALMQEHHLSAVSVNITVHVSFAALDISLPPRILVAQKYNRTLIARL